MPTNETDPIYTPASPDDISGRDFVSQTESAINQLGETASKALEQGEAALQKAVEAMPVAVDALSQANQAITAAEGALTQANSALALANTVSESAQKADESANVALKRAVASEARADAAVVAADEAVRTADDAWAKAGAAQTAAGNARALNGEVEEKITNLLIYRKDETLFDANDAIASGNIHITDPACANLPTPESGFLAVRLTEEKDRYYQSFIPESNAYTASRTGMANGSQIIWEEWAETGGDQRIYYYREQEKRSNPNRLVVAFESPVGNLHDGDIFNVRVNAESPSDSETVTLKVDIHPEMPVYRGNHDTLALYKGDLCEEGLLVFQYVQARIPYFALLNPATITGVVPSEGKALTTNYERVPVTLTPTLDILPEMDNILVTTIDGDTLTIRAQPFPAEQSKIVTMNIQGGSRLADIIWPEGMLWVTEEEVTRLGAGCKALVNLIFGGGLVLGQYFYADELPEHTIIFDTDGGGENPEPMTVMAGDTFTMPAAPQKVGMDFESWFDSSLDIRHDPHAQVRAIANMHFVAQWR